MVPWPPQFARQAWVARVFAFCLPRPSPPSEGCPQGLDVSGSAELTVEASAERRGGSVSAKRPLLTASKWLVA